jgi:fused signal recognition particle receptor
MEGWILFAVALAGALPLGLFGWLLRARRRQRPPREVRPTAAPLPVEPAPAPAVLVPAPPAPGLGQRLARTRDAHSRLGSLLGERVLDAELLDELEALLFAADLGVKTAEDLLERVRREAPGGGAERVRAVLRQAIAEKLARIEPSGEPLALAAKPHVVLVLGVNGSGKTTTIGKLAARTGRPARPSCSGRRHFRAARAVQR